MIDDSERKEKGETEQMARGFKIMARLKGATFALRAGSQ